LRHCPFCLTEFPAGDPVCPADAATTVATRGEAADRSLLGKTVGSYQVTRAIARGGMGEVYEAVHPQIGRRVAIKVLGIDAVQDPLYVQRFFNEARAVNVIHHENIIEVIDLAALPDKRPYLVMEYLDGESLATRLATDPTPPLPMIGQVLLPVLDALQAAHIEGILHRDLKPDNIFLVERRGELVPKILDFGIAKLAQGNSSLTAAGLVLGTPRYMAPEQARGLPLDSATDLYSMGVIAFEMCCGRLPFLADAYAELLVMHIMNEPPKPRSIRPELSDHLELFILRSLRKEIPQRWHDAQEMGEALRRALLASGVAEDELPALKRRSARGAAGAPALSATGMGKAAERPDVTLPATPLASSQQARARSDRTMRAAAAEVLTPAPLRASRAPLWIAVGAAAMLVLGIGAFVLVSATANDGAEDVAASAPTARSLDGDHSAGSAPESVAPAPEPEPETAAARAPAATGAAGAAAAPAPATGAPPAVAETAAPHGALAKASGKKAKKKRGGRGGAAPAPGTAADGATAAPEPTAAPDAPVSPDEFDASLKKPGK